VRTTQIKDTITESGLKIKTGFVQQGPMIGWASGCIMKYMNILSSALVLMLIMTTCVFAQSNGLSSTASGLSSLSEGSTATANREQATAVGVSTQAVRTSSSAISVGASVTGISNFTPETTEHTKRVDGIESGPGTGTESTGSTEIIGRCNDPDYLRDRKRGLNPGSRLTCLPQK